MSADDAYSAGLVCEHKKDLHTALQCFRIADRRFRNYMRPDSDEVLAAQMGQVRCLVGLGRYQTAYLLATQVLDLMGDRLAVRDVDRPSILWYQAAAAAELPH